MKKTILMMFVLGLVSLNGSSQKVYKGFDGKVYLECTVSSGMPAGSITKEAKCMTTSPSMTENRPEADDEIKTVFEKLEIDKADYNDDKEKPNWVDAYNDCKSKNTAGVTGWRLPTIRELILIHIFRAKLEPMLGQPFKDYFYWSSSELFGSDAYYFTFSGHSFGFTNKQDYMHVRCVREVN